MSKALDKYLKYLNEKEWDEKSKWEELINKDLLRNVITRNDETGEDEININRHTMQPVLMNLIKNVGGDYMGRSTTRNADHGDFAGIEYILNRLPDDWEEKVKQYVMKIAKKHKE